ncbi:MAG: hypothetical protein RBU37_03040 [Myxococcota bacterium]|nr:hypothetical protein [Myxococcota bacterium]
MKAISLYLVLLVTLASLCVACKSEPQSERTEETPQQRLPKGWQDAPSETVELVFDSARQDCPPCAAGTACEPCRPPFELFRESGEGADVLLIWVQFVNKAEHLVPETRYRLQGRRVSWPPHGDVFICEGLTVSEGH